MKKCTIIGMLLLGLSTFFSAASWAAGPEAVSIVQDPTAVGTPVGKRGPKTLKFTLEAQEVLGVLDAAAKHYLYLLDIQRKSTRSVAAWSCGRHDRNYIEKQ